MNRLGSREFWVPGWRQGAIFLLIVFLGLGAWTLRAAIFRPVIGGDGPLFLIYLVLQTGVPLYALLALLTGFFAPKGFYFWGIAVVLSHPFAAVSLAAYKRSQGFQFLLGGGWSNYVFVIGAMTLVTAVFLTTPLSAVGAGLRLLLDHLRRGRAGASRDVRAR